MAHQQPCLTDSPSYQQQQQAVTPQLLIPEPVLSKAQQVEGHPNPKHAQWMSPGYPHILLLGGSYKWIMCLLQAAAEAPEALQPGDVGVLAQFLGGKLSDW